MGTPRIEVGDLLVQHPLEARLVDDEQMIQTLRPRGSDPALGERVRPRRLRGCPELSHPESSQAPIKRFAIPAVPVTEEIPRRIPIPATGVHDLLGSPVGGGMSGHPNLQDLPSLVVHHEEDVQRPEEHRPHPEEVARPDVLGMDGSTTSARWARGRHRRAGACTWRRSGPTPPNPSRASSAWTRRCPHRRFSTDIRRIKARSARRRGGRPAPPSWPGPPSPIGRPSPAMPTEHGIRLDDEERVAPCGKPSTDENPEPAVTVTEPWAWHPALQHDQLLTQAQILDDQVRSGFRPCRDRSPRPPDHADPPPSTCRESFTGPGTREDGGSSSCAYRGYRAIRSPRSAVPGGRDASRVHSQSAPENPGRADHSSPVFFRERHPAGHRQGDPDPQSRSSVTCARPREATLQSLRQAVAASGAGAPQSPTSDLDSTALP